MAFGCQTVGRNEFTRDYYLLRSLYTCALELALTVWPSVRQTSLLFDLRAKWMNTLLFVVTNEVLTRFINFSSDLMLTI
jgi:hypothetical protein